MILETQRLYLREMQPSDAENAYLLNLDPEVIQYTGDDAFESVEAARSFLEAYLSYHLYGFGRWAVIRKEDDAFLGWCGLKYLPEEDQYDIGYRFMQKYWNQGYATEAALPCLALGFEKFGMQTIVGRARKENLASIKVLEKIGLSFVEDYEEDGESWVLYEISRKVES